MKKITSWKELEGSFVIKKAFRFSEKKNLICEIGGFKVLSVDNTNISIKESIPYSSSHTISPKQIIKNTDDFKEILKERVKDNKTLFKVSYIANHMSIEYFSTKDPEILEGVAIDGRYSEYQNNIICSNLNEIVKIFEENFKHLFFLPQIDKFSVAREGKSERFKRILVTPSARDEYLYQITLFEDNSEIPFGHINISDREELNYWFDVLEFELK